MRAITYELELKDGRMATLTLPEDIPPGKHQVVLVIDDGVTDDMRPRATYEELLMQTSGLWAQSDGLRYQKKIRHEWDRQEQLRSYVVATNLFEGSFKAL